MAKWTPGPWASKPCDNDFRAFDAQDFMIISDKMIVPALVWGGKGWKEGEANARLIAAAPEMFEALQRLLYAAEFIYKKCDLPNWETFPQIVAARAVLAKASGGDNECQ